MANLASGDSPRCVAVLDIGSNTVLLLILDRGGRVLEDRASITGLGRGVFERGHLDPAARERTLRTVVELAAVARGAGAEQLVAVATEALRRADDGVPFLEELRRAAALDRVKLLAGDEEAALAIAAAQRALGPGEPLVLLDVGGGSTELAWLERGRVRSLSLPLGAVRLSEACVSRHPLPRSELAELRSRARGEIARQAAAAADVLRPGAAVVAVGGTATTLAALDQRLEPYDPARVEGYRVARERLTDWVERIAALDLDARAALPGLEPGRADVIVAGLVILDEALLALGARELRSSGRGVRYGVALGLLAGQNPV